MRDFLPADVRKREYVISIIKDVYESYGFEPLETPAVENLETLTGKYGEEGNQLIFKILKRGEKLDLENASKESDLSDLALRYDLTVPLARVVANNKNDLPKFFKRYQIQPVWRADRPARGRFREFYQCDVDVIGSESMVVEAELLVAVGRILEHLHFINYEIKLGHRKLLTGLLEVAEVEHEKQTAVLVALDKLDKNAPEEITKELINKGVGEQALKILELGSRLRAKSDAIWNQAGINEEKIHSTPGLINKMIFEELSAFLGDNQNGKEGLAEIDQILTLASQQKLRGYVIINPLLARGLSYYTGAIFEIKSPLLDGSLGGGGRYDGLIGMFGKDQIPACGFSLGLERILVVMEERGMFEKPIAEGKLKLDAADVLVTIWSEETIAESLKLANELRANGFRVTLYPQADKEDKQWKYANSIKVSWICTVNQTDIDDGFVSFQNFRTRERFREPLDKVAEKIKNHSA